MQPGLTIIMSTLTAQLIHIQVTAIKIKVHPTFMDVTVKTKLKNIKGVEIKTPDPQITGLA